MLRELRNRLHHSRTIKRLRSNRAVIVAVLFLIVVVVIALLARVISPWDPNKIDVTHKLMGPSREHWLGTDSLGRDMFTRLLVGGRVTLLGAIEATAVAIAIGIPLGLIAGFRGRWTDAIPSRGADGLQALPPLLFAFAIVGILGRGLGSAMLALGIALAPRFFRVTRGVVQSIGKDAYIEAARADGVSNNRILLRHALPNASGPLLVQISVSIGIAVTAEASLSFLGLGVQSPQSSWGTMLRDGFNTIRTKAYPLLPPSVMVALTIVAFFAIGDGLRDATGRGSDRAR